eukprot:TRINITY_DN5384_c6_g1_i1.p1 TRINITY_DN5384_c6_g1~~TRINITY_DN5384_c6_g1_i1.p1  ORF type:complete len:728 (+),score=181.42 TRINITY_DN5384_c6_g1_i1:73-2256(+)
MRIFRKGGTWKNHEDEILKVAVMKYGKNSWPRVASLLPKKTASQAKERWNSWLDPSIKKTEWTKEEEEKLLHLAKRLPCQWRTIAPIVGRTPYQCLEHYDKLLDQAQEKEGDYDPTTDPRKLRPGEVDPNPEQRAPMPDAQDMSDDEREMLNEARARVANTKGKKAKRKARSKQLEEARRLAAVQKRRELKAAGIEVKPKTKRRGINFATEIPFYKAPAQGFFDTSEELKLMPQDDSNFRNLDVRNAEGGLRAKAEQEARKQDKKKAQKKRQEDLPAHFEALNAKQEADMIPKKPLSMSAPQVTERELFALKKMRAEQLREAQSESAATIRTPLVEDHIKLEAENQAKMRDLNTPLLGGETPSIRQTQMTSGSDAPPATPSHYTKMIQEFQPGTTGLSGSLDSLPAPKGKFSVALQVTDKEKEAIKDTDKELVTNLKTDHIDQQDATEVRKKKKSAGFLSTPTSASSRSLPCPFISAKPLKGDSPADLIENELQQLITYDGLIQRNKKNFRKKVLALDMTDYMPSELKAAKKLVEEELSDIKSKSKYYEMSEDGDYQLSNESELANEIESVNQDYVFVPNPPRFINKNQCSVADKLSALKYEFDVTRSHTAKAADSASKLETKVDVLTAGYRKRFETLSGNVTKKWEELFELTTKLKSYENVWAVEEVAIRERTRVSVERSEALKQRHNTLQARYADSVETLRTINEKIKRGREESDLNESHIKRKQ